MINRYALPFVALSALAACGGGGTGGNQVDPPPAPPTPPLSPAFSEIYLDGSGIINSYQESTLTLEMPTGSATYDGAALFLVGYATSPALSTTALDRIKSSPEFVGTATLNVDFNSNTASGQISDIRDSDGALASGNITIGGGAIDGSTLTASMVGNLATPDLSGNVTGSLEGSFKGDNGEAVVGTFAGSVGPNVRDYFVGIIAVDQ